ncbi:MAG: chromate transporter [Candidatus Rokubacteria bacterium]|nr:chromate transporter [Candidatus Rokubacteria bacterium]
MVHAELFARFVLVSLLAFGGGQAALPLVERMAVEDTGWLAPATFASAVACSYITPGPILSVATFVGYHVSGIRGAFAATLGAFLMPWMLATTVARQIARFVDHRGLRSFGAGATPAVIGLLGVTALDLGRDALVGWPQVAIATGALLFGALTRIHPVALLAAGGLAGWLIG